MALPVSLRAVAEEMDVPSETFTAYVNRRTGELFTVSEEEAAMVDQDPADLERLPDWQQDLLPKVREVLESEDFLPLPGKLEIHEWAIMERFARSLDDPRHREQVGDALHGSGAFGRFKAVARAFGLEETWFRYRSEALEEIAREFLEAHEIPFVE